MRIAIYVPAWPPGNTPNGIVTYASFLIPALREMGHEVFVLTFAAEDKDDYTIDLAKYRSNANWDRLMFNLAPRSTLTRVNSSAIFNALTDLFQRHKLDVLEIEESFGYSHTIASRNILPVIVRLHGPSFLLETFGDATDKSKIRHEGNAIESASFVTSCSVETLHAVRKYYSLPLSNSQVIPNPMTLGASSWEISSCDRNKILYVGRFDNVKGGDVMLLAFAKLASAFPELHLTFVGPDRGLRTKSNRKLSMDEFIRNNLPEDARSRITFLGQLNNKEVMSLRQSHFINVISSRYETQGYGVMEALSLGCPIVATAVGGIPEVIVDQQNGLLAPPDNPNALATLCETLLRNNDLARRLGKQGRRDCRAHYDPKIIADRTVTAYLSGIDTFRNRNTSNRLFGSG